MSDSLEELVKIISIITALVACVRLIISISNRSVIEIILISKSTRAWEDFIEVLLALLFIIVSLTFPVLFLKLEMNESILGFLMVCMSILFVCSLLIIIGYSITYFFTNKIKKYVEVLKKCVLTNMISLLLICYFAIFSLKSEILIKINSKDLGDVIYGFVSLYVFLVFAFYIYRNIYAYYNGVKNVAYKVELIDSNQLKELYYIFALDTDRLIFANYPVSKKSLTLPVYLYYPKEKSLYRFSKEQ